MIYTHKTILNGTQSHTSDTRKRHPQNLPTKTSTALFAAQVNNGAVIQIWKIAFMISSVTPQDDVLTKRSLLVC